MVLGRGKLEEDAATNKRCLDKSWPRRFPHALAGMSSGVSGASKVVVIILDVIGVIVLLATGTADARVA